jgi:GT2 family glycosyltransferase
MPSHVPIPGPHDLSDPAAGSLPVSIVTALYNCLPLTRNMHASLLATLPAGLDYEIIYVDDGSTDGTREWLDSVAGPSIRVILHEKNLGYAAANNRGAAAARGEVLVLLNNDLVLLPGWLPPMLQGLAQLPRSGVIGNIQHNARTGVLDHRGVCRDWMGRPRHDRRRHTLAGLRDYVRYPAVTAACCLVRTRHFREHGGFDVVYSNGCEDIDFCLRLNRIGLRHYVASRSRVLHFVSSSPGRHAKNTKNMQLFMSRWGRGHGNPGYRLRGIAYILRYWNCPWCFNGPKLCLALAWVASNQACPRIAGWLETSIKP